MAELLNTKINGTLNVNDYFNIDENGNLILNSKINSENKEIFKVWKDANTGSTELTLNGILNVNSENNEIFKVEKNSILIKPGGNEIFKVDNNGSTLNGTLNVKSGENEIFKVWKDANTGSTGSTLNGTLNVKNGDSDILTVKNDNVKINKLLIVNKELNVNGNIKATETITTPTIQDEQQNYYINQTGVKFYAPTVISATNKQNSNTGSFTMTVEKATNSDNIVLMVKNITENLKNALIVGSYIDIKSNSIEIKNIRVDSKFTETRRLNPDAEISTVYTAYLYTIHYTIFNTPGLALGSTVTVSLSEDINVLSIVNNIAETDETTFSVNAKGEVKGKALYDNSNRVYTPETFHLYETIITFRITEYSGSMPISLADPKNNLKFKNVYITAKRILNQKMTIQNNGAKGICFKIGNTIAAPFGNDGDLVSGYITRDDDKPNYNIRSFYDVDKYGIKKVLIDGINYSTKTISSISVVNNIYNTKETLAVNEGYSFFWGVDSTTKYSMSVSGTEDSTEDIKYANVSLKSTNNLGFIILVEINNRKIC